MSVTITQTDLETRFGTSNIASWSNLEGGITADTTRIAEALNQGMDRVRDAFRNSRYQVPFSSLGGTLYPVKELMVIYAGVWLFFSRGTRDTELDDRYAALERKANADIRAYLSGQKFLNAARSDTMPTAPIAV